MKRIFITVVIIATIAIGGWKLSAQKSTGESPTPPMPTNITTDVPNSASIPSEPIPSSAANSAVKKFTVTGKNYSFSLSAITVQKGDRVKILFKNEGGFHDLKIDEFNVATKQIKGGETDTIEFTADKSGSFEYYCSVGSHRAMGMKGTLTVE